MATSVDTSSPVYTCDELTPDLCELRVEEGQVEIKGINVAYWKYTAANAIHIDATTSTTNKLWPIVAIHGGPGFAHNYMLPLKQQACRGRTIVFYDQGGCGKSSLPTPTTSVERDYPWLLDPMYYATVELPALLRHLQFTNTESRFHIAANSWGTTVAQLYALDSKDETRQKLASMVLSGPLSDVQAYIQAQWDETDGSLGSLPPFIQQRIRALTDAQQYDSDEYQALTEVLTGKFIIRTQPTPDCWNDALELINNEIYTKIQGPSEFSISGVLEFFNVTGRLHELHDLPVLLSHGKYDTIRPSTIETIRKALPYAE